MNTTNHQSPITRTIVIGDIHGCHDELLDLLAEVNFTATDRAVAVGDLIVKGPKSKEVLDLFISDHRFSSVLGNHDLAVLNFLQGRDFKYSKAQKEASRDLQSDRKRYADFLSSLPLTIDLSSHLVVRRLTTFWNCGHSASIAPVEKERPGTASMTARNGFCSATGLHNNRVMAHTLSVLIQDVSMVIVYLLTSLRRDN